MISSSRRGFLRGLAGVSLLSAGGCFTPHPRKPGQKVRLAAVGIMGKGYSDWTPMLKTGLVEMVAFCDADANMLTQALGRAKKDFPDLDLSKVPFYTDYRKLLDDADKLGIDAMTISTPDHVHAPVAIQAMKKGIHVYVQKPLVRTLWELDYFNKTARENGVVVQMGNQGSSLDSMRRCTEVLQSGILGDVTEVHVWTNRPVWPQGKGVADWVKGHPKGDPIRKGLDWNAWLATAADRPFLDQYPKDADVYDPWNLGKNVYHTFTWRGFFDFGAGAFGDMACHTMNLPFRGLELGAVKDAQCTMIDSENKIAYPLKSIVKLTYAERESKVRKGVKLPAVTLYWYDGQEKPSADLMPQVIAKDGKVPNTGCLVIGTNGILCSTNDYGQEAFIALKGEKVVQDTRNHPACKDLKAVRPIPLCKGVAAAGGMDKSSGAAALSADGHYVEFLTAILGTSAKFEETNSRCYSDVDYSIPMMEAILVGTVAQRLPNQLLKWCTKKQQFDNEKANSFIKPYIRRGFEF